MVFILIGKKINGDKPKVKTLNPCFRSRTPMNRVFELGEANSTKLLLRSSSDGYRSEGGLKKIPLLVTLICFLYVGCSDKYEKEAEICYYSKVINLPEIEKDYQAIVIIPAYLCISCNSYIFDYCVSLLSTKKDVKIIFSNNKERISEYLSPELLDSPRIDFISLQDTVKFQYPTILYLKAKKIDKIEYQNLENPFALENLINQN